MITLVLLCVGMELYLLSKLFDPRELQDLTFAVAPILIIWLWFDFSAIGIFVGILGFSLLSEMYHPYTIAKLASSIGLNAIFRFILEYIVNWITNIQTFDELIELMIVSIFLAITCFAVYKIMQTPAYGAIFVRKLSVVVDRRDWIGELCCICLNVLGDNTLTWWCDRGCGQSIHQSCVDQHFENHNFCPLCKRLYFNYINVYE
jgi:hypothetical protein